MEHKVKLVHELSGEEIKVGDTVKTFRGEDAVVTHMRPPQHSASSGKVTVRLVGNKLETEFFPSVIFAKFKE